MNIDEVQLKHASRSCLYSLLNLTVLPGVAFILLWVKYRQAKPGTLGRYYAKLGVMTNLWAATALIFVTGIMLVLGGFNSPWTWVYVVSYFVLVHASFVLFATWVLTCSWTGEKLKKLGQPKF